MQARCVWTGAEQALVSTLFLVIEGRIKIKQGGIIYEKNKNRLHDGTGNGQR